MDRKQTDEEVRKEYIEKLGAELGPIYYDLWNECCSLHVEWYAFQELFGTKPSRVELLNEGAGVVCHIVQFTLFDHILLHLCRLTDPVRSCGKDNLSLKRLLTLINERSFRQELEPLVTDANDKCQFARELRNRVIAHRDLSVALRQPAEPLPNVTVGHITDAIAAIATAVKRVSEHYLKSSIYFEGLSWTTGIHARLLLLVLRDGLDAEKQRKERALRGEGTPEDIRPQPEI